MGAAKQECDEASQENNQGDDWDKNNVEKPEWHSGSKLEPWGHRCLLSRWCRVWWSVKSTGGMCWASQVGGLIRTVNVYLFLLAIMMTLFQTLTKAESQDTPCLTSTALPHHLTPGSLRCRSSKIESKLTFQFILIIFFKTSIKQSVSVLCLGTLLGNFN